MEKKDKRASKPAKGMAVVGEEYKLKKQKSTPKKIARVFIWLWVLFVIAPAMYFMLTKSNNVKEYAVVKSIAELNTVLMKQYNDMTGKVLSNIDVSKYTNKITIPDIKLDAISATTSKVTQTTSALAKMGIKGTEKIDETTNALQKQVDKVNTQIKDTTQKVQKTLETDITAALKKEVSSFGDDQVQKQLQLNNATYAKLSKGQFGLMTAEGRAATSGIYAELAKAKTGIVKDMLTSIDMYFKWIMLGLTALLLIILLIPPVLAWWIGRKLSSVFTECPYCHKVFLSKKGKLGLLKLFK